MFPLLGNTASLLKTPVRVVGIDLGTTNSTVAEITFAGSEATPPIRCINVDQVTTQGRYTHVGCLQGWRRKSK